MDKSERLTNKFLKVASTGSMVIDSGDMKEIIISIENRDENIKKISRALSTLNILERHK